MILKPLRCFLAALLAAALWTNVGCGQLVARTEAGSSVTATTASKLRLTPMRTNSGSSAIAANATALNSWFATGWMADRLQLTLNDRYGVSSTIDMGAFEANGISTAGAGGSDVRTESEFLQRGGAPAGLVWANRNSQTGPLLRYRGSSAPLGNLQLYGNFGDSTRDALLADTAHRCSVLLEVQGNQNGIGVGKIDAGILGVHLAGVGIDCIPTPIEDNADQGRVRRLVGVGTDTLFRSRNKQCLGWRFDYVDQYRAATAFEFQRGGDLRCDFLCMQTSSQTGLVVSGNDGSVQIGGETRFVNGEFQLDQIRIDATAPKTCTAVAIQPAAGYSAFVTEIGRLSLNPTVADDATRRGAPLVVIANHYGRFTIGSGVNLYPKCIKVTGGVPAFFPTIVVRNCIFRRGSDLSSIRSLFTDNSAGYVSVIFEDCNEGDGQADGAGPVAPDAVNGGKLYADYENLIEINASNSNVVVH